MSFNSAVRKVDGRVKIDFLSNKLENDVRITETSRGKQEQDAFGMLWRKYIDHDFIADDKRIAFVIDEATMAEMPQAERCYLVGAGTPSGDGYRLLDADSRTVGTVTSIPT